MRHDPFGNLTDWGMVLEVFEDLADSDRLAECQPGLIRILRFKGNWRLREEVLKRIGQIQAPSEDLMAQVLSIVDDDNVYFDARVMACDALVEMLQKVHAGSYEILTRQVRTMVEKLKRTPQPPFFDAALDRVSMDVAVTSMLEN